MGPPTQSRLTGQCGASLCGCSVQNCRHSLVLVLLCFSLLALAPTYETKQSSSRQVSVVSLAQQLAPVAGVCLLFPCSDLFTLLEHIPYVSSSGLFHVIITPVAIAFSVLFLSSFSFHDTIRKGGCGPC